MKYEKGDYLVNKYHSDMFGSMTSGDRRLLLCCFFCFLLGLLGTPLQIKENPMSEPKELDILTQTFVARNLSNLVTFHTSESFGGNNITFSRMDLTLSKT